MSVKMRIAISSKNNVKSKICNWQSTQLISNTSRLTSKFNVDTKTVKVHKKKIHWRLGTALAYTSSTFFIGYLYGQQNREFEDTHPKHVLPDGQPRTCCSEIDSNHEKMIHALEDAIGKNYVIPSTSTNMASYVKGARLGQGSALCVIRPGTLTQAIQCLQIILDHDCVVIPQGANTGLTGGSVPRDNNKDFHHRPAVVLNMRRLNAIHPVDNGKSLLCFAGAGIAHAQKVASSFQRESHSILGSTFLNPTVAAGVAFGSGGTQMRKGPAYTDRALYIKVKEDGKTLEIINKLSLLGLDSRQNIIQSQLDNLDINEIKHWESDTGDNIDKLPAAHDSTYCERLCSTDKKAISRYNADTSGTEVNRSEGKVLILASIHDTFPTPKKVQTWFITFRSFDTALKFRKEVALHNPKDLPISMEYMDRDSFDVIDRAGRILAGLIQYSGSNYDLIGSLWNIKSWIESLPLPYANVICDHVLFFLNNAFPEILPKRLMYLGRASDHHIMLTVGEFEEKEDIIDSSTVSESIANTKKNSIENDDIKQSSLTRLQQRLQSFHEKHKNDMTIHACNSSAEVNAMQAFRFVAAPAFKTWCVGNSSQGISVDYALPVHEGRAPNIGNLPLKRMRYSHFGCNVVHEDLAYARGVDVHKEKMKLKKMVENSCGGRLPAEHGHGIEYIGPEEAQTRWIKMDPANVMNPGIGGLKSTKNYK